MNPKGFVIARWRHYWAKKLGVLDDHQAAIIAELNARVEMYRRRAEMMQRIAQRWRRLGQK